MAEGRAKAAEAAVVAGTSATPAVSVAADGSAGGSLKRRIEAILFELAVDLKVSGVPEAVVLSGFIQVWMKGVGWDRVWVGAMRDGIEIGRVPIRVFVSCFVNAATSIDFSLFSPIL